MFGFELGTGTRTFVLATAPYMVIYLTKATTTRNLTIVYPVT